MGSSIIANRYAKALLILTENQSINGDQALSFLTACEELFQLSESRKILKSPVMPQDIKLALLSYAAEKSGAGGVFNDFSGKLIEAGRTTYLPEIAKSFRKMLSERRGVAEGVVKSAEILTEAMKKDLTDSLGSVFNKKITLQNEIDKKVLGGIVVNIGNYTIDLSLKSRLNSIADFAQR